MNIKITVEIEIQAESVPSILDIYRALHVDVKKLQALGEPEITVKAIDGNYTWRAVE